MTDIKSKLPNWLTPQLGISTANFIAIAFTAGTIWATNQNEREKTRDDIRDLKIEVRALRANETSIAVLKANTDSIKDSVQRIETRVDKLAVQLR